MAAPRPEPNCCAGFTRTEALRRSLAARTAGVREWDARMPLPAGTGIDRRRFLLGAGGGLMAVYGAGRLRLTDRAIGEGIAQAAEIAPGGPILVSVFLAGGIDALSLLAPVADPLYAKLRPTLAVPADGTQALSEDSRLHWNANAASLAQLHAAGKVTVIPGIGYSDPDMSHFTSRHYWEVGATDTRLLTGWMGRYLDIAGSSDNPLQGLSMDGSMNPTLATARNPVAAIDTPYDFYLGLSDVWGPVSDQMLDAASALGSAQAGSREPAIAQVAQAASEVGVVRHALSSYRTDDGKPTYTSPVTYPSAPSQGDFPERLAGLAALIAGGLPLRCVALTFDTQFDTHSGQAATFNPALQTLSESLAAFQSDLEARGLDERVIVHVWSEFGRRAQENGSGGTDHGAAGTSLLIGSRASGTMVGEWPDIANLDPNGNQVENVDFRGVYSSLLEQWFDQDAAAVIPGAASFPRYTLIS